jgi:FHA domain-containing protein/cohesin domain-containing protein
MKRLFAIPLAMLVAIVLFLSVSAQSTDSIWLTASTTAYKTGETVVVTVNATAGTPVQGFTFQVRYDPACLKPTNASSQVPGMNGLPLPQISGQVDGSYASTSPQVVNGVLAEIYFQALKGCQTDLTLESAALAIRNAEGYAAPLPNVPIVGNQVALNIDKEVGVPQPVQQKGANLPLEPTIFENTNQGKFGWLISLVAALVAVGAGAVIYKRFRSALPASKPGAMKRVPPISKIAKVHFKHGPYAGKSFALNRLPFFIGRDPMNDLCLNDPHILSQHAKIFETSNGYYLMDLGGETYVNGQMVRRNSAFLKPGDVVRLGKSALFVFGS